ncbi:sugar kinase [Roseibium aestuarii]|uniref:Sugar kinase n=1 Tax=Roseibium aestuarii TaxID=2600299 RepID=A0ABW4JZI1_9HYPH|nr:sugar kinase [Roseibium aestuarii]
MTQRLLCIGECMVELSPRGEDSCAIGYAGDTFNTAFYARQVAGPEALRVAYQSGVGDDELSARMIAFMEAQGVETRMHVVPGATVGLYMIFLKNGERSFQYWRAQSAARRLAEGLETFAALQPGDTAYFSGITLAILTEADRERLLDWLAQARARGVRTAFDPNLRPRLWPSADDMRDWTMRGAGVADVILPSFEDEATWFGDADLRATAERYLAAGADLLIVKDGPGAVLIRQRGREDVLVSPAPVREIVDTTSAGDAFNGAVLAALAEGTSLERAVALGCDVAGQVVQQRGALVQVSLARETGSAVAG